VDGEDVLPGFRLALDASLSTIALSGKLVV
jgi:hypothetical protein